ncbi:ABC transporter ATP-binding protein [Leucobacter sp. wl10]|nr:ABC transporter ATP-binding protein [Leucobacter sp. wl10]
MSPEDTRSTTASAADAHETREVAVQFRGVRKSFKHTTILPGLDLDIFRGELVTLLGPSGCGKTTTLRLLAGFEHPDAGEVMLDGRRVDALAAHRRDIGMVFQSYSLFPNLSVAGNVDYGLRILKLRKAERTQRIDELLELCGLDGFGDRYPHQLSGGQQQRVALARALAVRPAVMLLDEPLSALDASVRSRLRTEIRALQQRLGSTMLFVTHDQAEALAISDRIAVMSAGAIEQIAPPREVYEHPATPFVARFVGTVSEIPVPREWTGGMVPAAGSGSARTAAAGADVIFVRPEHLSLLPDETGEAVVVERTYAGETTRIVATLGGIELHSQVAAGVDGEMHPGTRVHVRADGDIALRVPAAAAGGSR